MKQVRHFRQVKSSDVIIYLTKSGTAVRSVFLNGKRMERCLRGGAREKFMLGNKLIKLDDECWGQCGPEIRRLKIAGKSKYSKHFPKLLGYGKSNGIKWLIVKREKILHRRATEKESALAKKIIRYLRFRITDIDFNPGWATFNWGFVKGRVFIYDLGV